ncbi:AfsR/SARP family transcriptional regulator [Nocardiopsis valliformis]|uniref:AfsR/SARP family transcriptional regulator n=1 Tax=Nocardiopsis valliformis TaxID=239974 RepID=UPI000348DD94|nr:BTAD domain-containing putative transcriptional regulator [Nocardiopsis valliformis]
MAITSVQRFNGDEDIAFRVLGPLEVRGPAGLVRVPSGRQQTVLSALLLDLNRVVATDYLVDILWAHQPPETVRTQVQICVSRIRGLLQPTGVTIETRSPGYLLSAEAHTVDAHVFRARAREATDLIQEGRQEEAAAVLRSSVGLWRGPAFSGITADGLRVRATHLDEERMAAIESYLGIELALGRHNQLIGEINTLVQEHPLREGLRAQLMLALYRSGRQADALEAYRAGRDLLIDELGLEPGTELRELEQRILAADESLRVAPPAVAGRGAEGAGDSEGPGGRPEPSATAATAITPFQLPTDTADFVGRTETARAAERTLVENDGKVGVLVLVGRPGVGKSATAVHIAHRLGPEHFPDGQLYCDLRAIRGNPLTPADALGRFLRALGVPGQAIPDDTDERAAMYRGLLATRRVLVVLDDAASETQVLPLVPAGPGCGVVITSRTNLTGMPGAALVQMETLSGDTSLELLAQVLGEERVAAEPEAARALVRSVGRLPLALRIVSARLAARRHWSIASMVARLADESHRLDELAHGDMTVRASLSMTFDGLERPGARAFGLLGMVDGPTIPVWSAAALLDDGRPFPSDIVEPLVDAHLLDIVGSGLNAEPVYRFHDLVRDYSRERLLQTEDDTSRRQALERLMGGWLALLDAANRGLVGGDYLLVRGESARWNPPRSYVDRVTADPYAWLEAERTNLLHIVSQAVEEGLAKHSWELTVGVSMFLMRRGYMTDIADLHDRVEPLVRRSGDRLGAAAITADLANLLKSRYDDATRRTRLEWVLSEYTELGEVRGASSVRMHLAFMDHNAGDNDSALHGCENALKGFTSLGDAAGQRRSLMLSGYLRVRAGDADDGLRELAEALALAETCGDVRAQAQVLEQVALADVFLGDLGRAEERLNTALDLVRDLVDPLGEAKILLELSRVHLARGRVDTARAGLERIREIGEQLRYERWIRVADLALADISEQKA